MLDHVSIAVTSIETAEPFYDAIMQALGCPKVGRSETWLGYGLRADAAHSARIYLSVLASDGAIEDNKRHWALKAPERKTVDEFWRLGCAAGGVDDGEPGLRPGYHDSYYAAFLLDPDGNRIEAVCHRADPS